MNFVLQRTLTSKKKEYQYLTFPGISGTANNFRRFVADLFEVNGFGETYVMRQNQKFLKAVAGVLGLYSARSFPYEILHNYVSVGYTDSIMGEPVEYFYINDICYEVRGHSDDYYSVMENDVQIALIKKERLTYFEQNTYNVEISANNTSTLGLLMLLCIYIDINHYSIQNIITVVLLAATTMLLTSCKKITDISNEIVRSLLYGMPEVDTVQEIKDVLEIIKLQDTEGLKQSMSDSTVELIPVLDEQIDELFNLLGTDLEIIEIKQTGQTRQTGENRYIQESCGARVVANDINYYMSFIYVWNNEKHPEENGVKYISIYPEEYEDILSFFHSYKGLVRGITVKLPAKNWYNPDDLVPGTLYIKEKLVEEPETVLFNGKDYLIPLDTLFKYLGIELFRVDDNTATATYGNRNMELVFSKTEYEHYNTLHLTDIDTGTKITLGSGYTGLYTEIYDCIYVPDFTGTQICTYLGGGNMGTFEVNREEKILRLCEWEKWNDLIGSKQ